MKTKLPSSLKLSWETDPKKLPNDNNVHRIYFVNVVDKKTKEEFITTAFYLPMPGVRNGLDLDCWRIEGGDVFAREPNNSPYKVTAWATAKPIFDLKKSKKKDKVNEEINCPPIDLNTYFIK